MNKCEEKRLSTEEGDRNSNQETADKSSGLSDTDFQGSPVGCSSSHSPLTADAIQPVEQVFEDHKSSCTQTGSIHAPPEELVTAASKV